MLETHYIRYYPALPAVQEFLFYSEVEKVMQFTAGNLLLLGGGGASDALYLAYLLMRR